MKNSLLQSIRKSQCRKPVFLYFIFTFVIVSQLYSAHHQVQHLNDYNDIACMQCVVTPDYLCSSLTVVDLSLDLKHKDYAETLTDSVTISPPIFYSSRAPPTFS